MPTPLPRRHRILRRFAIAPETARNLAATTVEFACALVFAGATIFIIAHADLSALARIRFPGATSVAPTSAMP